jgi:exodeoxyribonuclease V alpha subunit
MNEERQFSRLDTAFSHFLSHRSLLKEKQRQDFEALILNLSSHLALGHTCLHIDPDEQSLVLLSGLADPTRTSPLVIEHDRLYLQRYWFYEKRLTDQIKQRLSQSLSDTDTPLFINKYFSDNSDDIDWQKEATKQAVNQSLSIITGGPGTGKTTTVVKILAILLEQAEAKNIPLHIALATPTGKAAKRLQESISYNKESLPCSQAIKKKIPDHATTIHRLLGVNRLSPYFKHNANRPLIYDVVIIDEASMVDLALMSKLMDALKPQSKFILLGDKDQLASVESGAVLRDLTTALPNHTVELKKSHRFHGEIKELAVAVNAQSFEKAWGILKNGQQASLLEENLIDYATDQHSHYLLQIKNKASFETIFHTFSQFQILCAIRHGEKGVININKLIEERLAQQHKIKVTGRWYSGRPVMVTQNSVETGLYNGDIGMCLPDGEARLAIFFLQPEGRIKKVLPSRLPSHKTVFAMSIHKSQGSEFDECLCVLPDVMNPVLTKELVYTAITRTKNKLKIHCTHSIFNETLQNKITRTSGVVERLTER